MTTKPLVNSQKFVDALRNKDFFYALQFIKQIDAKYSAINNEAVSADALLTITAYELSYSDINIDDLKALVLMEDNIYEAFGDSGTESHAAINFIGGSQTYLTYKSQLDVEGKTDTATLIQNEHQRLLSETDKPVKNIEKKGMLIKVDFINAPNISNNDKQIFRLENSEKINHEIAKIDLVANAKYEVDIEVNLSKITLLTEPRHEIRSYLNILNKSDNTNGSFIIRKNAAQEMLTIIDQAGDKDITTIITSMKAQVEVIRGNQPGLRELGLLGYLQGFFDKFRPEISKNTSSLIENLDQIKPANHNAQEFTVGSETDIREKPAHASSSPPSPSK